jgi:transposase
LWISAKRADYQHEVLRDLPCLHIQCDEIWAFCYSKASRAWLAELKLPPAAREQITIALTLIDTHDAQLVPLDQQLRDYAKRQPGCRALMGHYGIGPLTSVTILAELGDARRFQLLTRGGAHSRSSWRRSTRQPPALRAGCRWLSTGSTRRRTRRDSRSC